MHKKLHNSLSIPLIYLWAAWKQIIIELTDFFIYCTIHCKCVGNFLAIFTTVSMPSKSFPTVHSTIKSTFEWNYHFYESHMCVLFFKYYAKLKLNWSFLVAFLEFVSCAKLCYENNSTLNLVLLLQSTFAHINIKFANFRQLVIFYLLI